MGNDTNMLGYNLGSTHDTLTDTQEQPDQAAGSGLKEQVAHRVDSVKETFGNVIESAKNAISDNGAAATALIGARDGLASVVPQRADFVDKAKQTAGIARENPIGLALVGMSIGFLVGSLLPVSEIERKQLGPISDKVVDQAQAAAHDLVKASKAVVAETAQSVVDTALSSAQTHGREVANSVKARIDTE